MTQEDIDQALTEMAGQYKIPIQLLRDFCLIKGLSYLKHQLNVKRKATYTMESDDGLIREDSDGSIIILSRRTA